MNDNELTLYITDDCTLCDEALNLLLHSKQIGGVVLTTIDIALDDDLFDRLGDRIPVVEFRGCQLDWPFKEADVVALLSVNQIDSKP